MRNKIKNAKQAVKENKVGIAVVGTVTIVYGSMLGASYLNYQSARLTLTTELLKHDIITPNEI